MHEKNLKTCEVCGKKVVKLWQHMNIHRQEKPYKCSICHKGFAQKCSLTRHARIHSLETVTAFKCEVCQKFFTQKSTLTVHEKTIHKKEREFFCAFCQKDFTTNQHLWNHLLGHIKEKPHTCELCGESFCEIGTRNQHLRSHLQERVYKCEFCNKSFTASSSLLRHKKATHLNEDPSHSCVFCSKGFHEKSNMFKHIMVHLKEKPFSCQHCDASFTRAFERKRHVRRCLGTATGDGCYSTLARQEKISHDGKGKLQHECLFCAKTFLKKSGLHRHILTHLKEMPFTCKFCDASFSQVSNKRRHIRRHHGAATVAGA